MNRNGDDRPTELMVRGMDLLFIIVDELNEIAEEYRGPDTFRRREDFHELCVALALLEEALEEGLT